MKYGLLSPSLSQHPAPAVKMMSLISYRVSLKYAALVDATAHNRANEVFSVADEEELVRLICISIVYYPSRQRTQHLLLHTQEI